MVTMNQGVINGNIITIPNPSNPENPIIGTISSDGRTITWTEGGQLLETTTRDDIDECADASGTNPCDGTPGTGSYQTEILYEIELIVPVRRIGP